MSVFLLALPSAGRAARSPGSIRGFSRLTRSGAVSVLGFRRGFCLSGGLTALGMATRSTWDLVRGGSESLPPLTNPAPRAPLGRWIHPAGRPAQYCRSVRDFGYFDMFDPPCCSISARVFYWPFEGVSALIPGLVRARARAIHLFVAQEPVWSPCLPVGTASFRSLAPNCAGAEQVATNTTPAGVVFLPGLLRRADAANGLV